MLVSFFTYVECCFCYVRSSKIFSLATVVGDGDTWGFEDKNGTVECEADPFSTPAYFNAAGKATALGAIVQWLSTVSPRDFKGTACKVCVMEHACVYSEILRLPLKIN